MSLCFMGVCAVTAVLTQVDINADKKQFNDTTLVPEYTTTIDFDARTVTKEITDYNRESNKRFHDNEDTQVTVGGIVILDNNSAVTVKYDTGYDSAKYDKNQAVTIGYQKKEKLNEDWEVRFGGSVKFGGQERHTSCTDSGSSSRFYCTGDRVQEVNWDTYESGNDVDYSAGVTFTYRF